MAQRSIIDSNESRLRWAQETSPGVVDANATWYDEDPNSYGDFGSGFGRIQRRFIQASRQLKKGAIISLEVPANWNADLTATNKKKILEGFVYSTLATTKEMENTTSDTPINDVSAADVITAPSTDIELRFPVGNLVRLSGFGVAQNNTAAQSFTNVTAVGVDTITVAQDLAAEAVVPKGAKITAVGHSFTSGAVSVTSTGNFASYTASGTGQDSFLHLKVSPGEYIFVGGDAVGDQFAIASSNGWKRVRSVTATTLVVDKSTATMGTDAGAAKTIKMFVGQVLKDQADPTLIVRRTYQFERALGNPDDATPADLQAEYVTKGTPNTLAINIPSEDKVNVDLGYVGGGYETRVEPGSLLKSETGTGGVVLLPTDDMFNTVSDFSVLKIHSVSATDENPTELVAFIETMTLNINNNVSENKAVGVLGSAKNSIGVFQITGSITGYFSRESAIAAVKDNADVTLQAVMAAQNKAISIDLPLVALGNARLAVEQDVAIKIPLDPEAAEGSKVDPTLNHTVMFNFFDYVPNLALA